jgi:PAS domain S-box-containing protein
MEEATFRAINRWSSCDYWGDLMSSIDTLLRQPQHQGSVDSPTAAALLDFFDNGAVPLHLVDGDGRILYANKAELALLGYTSEEYLGRHIDEFHLDRPVITDILSKLICGETLRSYPARLRARNGEIKHVEITSSAHFEDGKFVNTRCFSVDVTDLVRAREDLRRKDEQMRQVLDALPAAVYTTDKDGVITYFNRAAVEFAGREPELGKDQWCVTFRLRTLDGEPLPHDQCPMAIAIKENRSIRGVEAMAQRPDGSLVPFLPFPTPLRDSSGALVGAVNMLVDVSARREAEANQRLLLDELNHRVKNNMQMLKGMLRSAQRETQNEEAREVLADAAQRVAAIASAQQLLYRESQPRSFDCHGFLEAVCDSAQQAFSSEISVVMESDPCELPNGTAMPLALILNELVTNAAKYGTKPDGTGTIRVSLTTNDSEATLSVSDEGPGFDPNVARSRRASGLGLVEGLVGQLGGRFTVESVGGAHCSVTFPKNLH